MPASRRIAYIPAMLKTSLSLAAAALALTLAPSALAAAPVVRTGPVERATATTATLTGTVNPGGHATQYRFEYGTTTRYGESTKVKRAGHGTKSVAVVGAATGLKANTTYHYRLIASNRVGRRLGADRFFRTPATVVGVTLARAETEPITFGERATLTGTVSGVTAGAPVLLEQRPAPFQAPFAALAQAATDAAGTFSFGVTPALDTLFRAFAAPGNVPASSGEIMVRVRPRIGFVLSRSVVRRGRRVIVRGTVTPAHDGQTVLIQKRNSRGNFSTVRRETLRPSTPSTAGIPRSSYRASVRVTRSSDYRVRLRAHADHANATSRERFITARGR